MRFQSTHPVRGAISEGRLHAHLCRFNPRTPQGVRLQVVCNNVSIPMFQSTHPARGAVEYISFPVLLSVFQSTHPARGAVPTKLTSSWQVVVSIHAPREGCGPR